jgi:hypothetical protein
MVAHSLIDLKEGMEVEKKSSTKMPRMDVVNVLQ